MVERVDEGDDDTVIPLLYFLVFLFFPIFLLISRFDISKMFQVLAENYGIIRFTFFQALVSASIVILIGVPLSMILARRRMNDVLKIVFNTLSKVPFVVPGISMALGFILLFGRNGLLNLILKPFHMKIDILYTFWAVILGHVFYNVPVVLYVLGTVWERLDGSLIESAMIDGASRRAILFKIELPNLLPAVLSSFLMAFVYSFTSFAVVLTLGGVRYSTIEVAIYTYLRAFLDFDSAVSLSIFQILVLSSMALLIQILKRSEIPSGEPLKDDMRSIDWIVLFSISFFTLSPLVLSILGGFLLNFRFSFENFRLLLKNIDVLRTSVGKIVSDTVSIASISATISLSISILTVRTRNHMLKTLPLVPSGVSTMILSFGYILAQRFIDVGETLTISFLHSIISLPMVYSIIENSYRSLDLSISESASIDGAGKAARFLYIELPLMFRAMLRAFTLSMAISMSDLAGVLTLSKRTFTLSSAIYRLSSSRHVREAMALNTILMLMIALIFSIGEITSSRDGSYSHRSRNRNDGASLQRDNQSL